MNNSLQVFNPREAFLTEYSAPAIDVLSDDGSFSLYVPAKPSVISAIVGRVNFIPVPDTTSYRLYRKQFNTQYELIATSTDPLSDHFSDVDIIVDAYYRMTAVNSAGTSDPSNSLYVAPALSITPGTLGPLPVDVPMSVTFVTPPSAHTTTWTLTEITPPGLIWDQATATLSGTPTVLGTNYFTITATTPAETLALEFVVEVV